MASHRPPHTVRSVTLLKGAAVWFCALACFAAFRWWARVEPLNSDDLVLFGVVKEAASGDHWLFSSQPLLAGHRDPLCLSCATGNVSHQALRIGLLPVALPVLYWLGPTLTAYYLMPLFFQLQGGVAVWLLIRRHARASVAWLGFGLLMIMPYELVHASVLLVDLPAAACLLWALWALGADALRTHTLRGLVAGLFITWAYFLRENTPVLLLPGLAVLALEREQRRPIAIALGTWAAGFGIEQWLYIAKGLGFGYRSRVVASALETYSPQLPVYSLGSFSYRYFVSFWRLFGGFPLGALSCLLLLGAIGLLGWLLVRSKTNTLRALAACGLSTWIIFAYAPFQIDGSHVRALAPPYPRYVQPLLYAGLIAAVISLDRAWQAIGAGTWARFRRPLAWGLGSLVSSLCAAWLVWDVYALKRLERANAPVSTTLDTLARLAQPAAEVWGPPLEIRVLELVSARRTPALRWHEAELPALLAQLERDPNTLVVRDPGRELAAQHYLALGPRRARLQSSQALDAFLWNNHQIVGLASGYSIFIPNGSMPTALRCDTQRWPAAAAWRPSPDLAPFALGKAVSYRLLTTGEDALTFAGEECEDCTFALRLELRLEGGARGKLDVQALGPGRPRASASQQDVVSGPNYLAWRSSSRAGRSQVELELSPKPGQASLVAFGPMEIRRCHAPPGLALAKAP